MSAVDAARCDLLRWLPDHSVLISPEDLIVHGYDGTWLDHRPAVVVVPIAVSDIVSCVRIARAHGVPIVPRGGGSGLAGGSVPGDDAIVLSTNRMNRILDIDSVGLTAVVEAGVVNATLQDAVEKVGLLYPPDPASLNQSTIGGNVATSAGGPRCLKYGGTRDYVVGLEVVTAGGDLLRLGGRSHQPLDDQCLLRLFIGSEGTLGIVTEVTVRLLIRPGARGTVVAMFQTLEEASDAVGAILASGTLPVALEMMDRVTLDCVEQFLHSGLPREGEAMLLIDVDGEAGEVDAQRQAVAQACRQAGAMSVTAASSVAESQRMWQARRSTSSSFGRLRPNKLGEDISVPRSAIPATVRAVQAIAESFGLTIPLFGHIGDGNLHPNILCDLRDPDEMIRVATAAREIFAVAIAQGGVISGEHGIGLLKRNFLSSGADPTAIALMTRIKDALDPAGLANPGKVLG